MKKSKKKLIIIVGVILVIFIGLISFFIISFNRDKKDTLKRMDNISSEYDVFSKSAIEFNTTRDDLYTNVFNGVYYDTLKVNYDVWINKLNAYEKLVDNIEEDASNLKDECNGVYYPSQDINYKCSAFGLAYEEIVNSFVSDINIFNNNINSYNEYVTNESDKLGKYKTSKKYIDYNKDSEYTGKESSNE